MRHVGFRVEGGVEEWQAPTTQQEADAAAHTQPRLLDSKPPTLSTTLCNVTGPLSISSYCPGPHEAQRRGSNPEPPPHGQSECLRADGPRDGGPANKWYEPPETARKQVSPWTPSLALGLSIKLWVREQSSGRGGTRLWKGKAGRLEEGDERPDARPSGGPNMRGHLGRKRNRVIKAKPGRNVPALKSWVCHQPWGNGLSTQALSTTWVPRAQPGSTSGVPKEPRTRVWHWNPTLWLDSCVTLDKVFEVSELQP